MSETNFCFVCTSCGMAIPKIRYQSKETNKAYAPVRCVHCGAKLKWKKVKKASDAE